MKARIRSAKQNGIRAFIPYGPYRAKADGRVRRNQPDW